jgi:phenylacetate-CoA ligase
MVRVTRGDQDFWALDQIKVKQKAHWEWQRNYLATQSNFYRRLWDSVEPPKSIADIPMLPFTTKQMLRDAQESPPFGDYLAAPIGIINRIHSYVGHHGTGDQHGVFRERCLA